MENLLPSGAEPGDDVLEIRSRRRRRAERHRIEGTVAKSDKAEAEAATHDLEALARHILVRDPVGGEMQGRPQHDGTQTRAGEESGHTANRDVQRDDHDPADERP